MVVCIHYQWRQSRDLINTYWTFVCFPLQGHSHDYDLCYTMYRLIKLLLSLDQVLFLKPQFLICLNKQIGHVIVPHIFFTSARVPLSRDEWPSVISTSILNTDTYDLSPIHRFLYKKSKDPAKKNSSIIWQHNWQGLP